MRDFLTFEFDGVSSSYYNAYIINDGEGISLPSSPQFNDQMTSPMYQNTSYYLGTNIMQRIFTFDCVAVNVTIEKYREMLRWLDIQKIGKLKTDISSDFYANVKITSLSDSIFEPYFDEYGKTYVIRFSLSFTTIDDYAQLSSSIILDLDVPGTYLDPIYKLPIVEYNATQNAENDIKEVDIINNGTADMYLNIHLEPTSSFKVVKNNGKTKYTYVADWDASTNIPTLTLVPNQNGIYYKVSRAGTFNNKYYRKDYYILARDNEWFEVDYKLLTDELFYDYDFSIFSGSEELNPIRVVIKSQYGFIIDKDNNRLIESSLNTLSEKYGFEYPESINTGLMPILPSNIRQFNVEASFRNILGSNTTYTIEATISDPNQSFKNISYLSTDKVKIYFGDGTESLHFYLTQNNIYSITDVMITFNISEALYNNITNNGQNTKFLTVLSFVNYESLMIQSGVVKETMTYQHLDVAPIKGFYSDKNLNEKLYYDYADSFWKIQRRFDTRYTKELIINSLEYNPDEKDPPALVASPGYTVTTPLAATNVITKGRSFQEQQEQFNLGLLKEVDGISLNTIRFYMTINSGAPIKQDGLLICSHFSQITSDQDIEGIYSSGNRIYFRMEKSRLSIGIGDSNTTILNKIKAYLSSRQIFIWYEIAPINEILSLDIQRQLNFANKNYILYGETTRSNVPGLDSRATYTSVGEDGMFLIKQGGTSIRIETQLRNNF